MKCRLIALGLLVFLAAPAAMAAEKRPVETVKTVCSKCHGPDGRGVSELFPRLAGQQAAYLERQLKAFRGRDRGDTHARSYMWGVAGAMSDAAIHGLATYLGSRPAPKGEPSADSALVARGKEIFEKGVAERGVPICAECHGAAATGMEEIPRLAGQYRDYLYRQIREFRGLLRRNDVMHDQTKAISDEEALAVAEYLSTL